MHAAETGWKEAERLVLHSHLHGLPRLDPEVDASTVQLVGYQTTREEIADLSIKYTHSRGCPDPLHVGLNGHERSQGTLCLP